MSLDSFTEIVNTLYDIDGIRECDVLRQLRSGKFEYTIGVLTERRRHVEQIRIRYPDSRLPSAYVTVSIWLRSVLETTEPQFEQ